MKTKLHLIPGTMCTEKLWRDVIPHLDETFELVYLTIPNHKNFDQLAAYYDELLEDQTVNLIGFSLGGYIASYFAKLYPHRMKRLLVIANSPTSLPSTELEQRSNILNFVKRHGYSGMSRKKAASMLDVSNQTDDYVDRILEMDKELGEGQFLSQYQNTSARPDLFDALCQFNFPTQLYFSEHDKLVNPQWLEKLRGQNRNVSILPTAGSGHMLPLEKPVELANLINQWLSRDSV